MLTGIRWLQVDNMPGDGDIIPPGKLMLAGHQSPCPNDGANGMWGELLCMTMDGAQAGHMD